MLSGQRAEATAAVPDEYLDLAHLFGDEAYVQERLEVFKGVGVTHLSLQPSGANALDDIEKIKAWVE